MTVQNETLPGVDPNATAPNATTVATESGRVVRVEEGPVWLAELLYAPPWWLAPVLSVAIVCLVAAIAYLAWRVVPDLDAEERDALAREYAAHFFVIGSIVGGTILLRDLASLPYWIDVFGGSALGFAFGEAVLRWVVPWVSDVGAPTAVAGSND